MLLGVFGFLFLFSFVPSGVVQRGPLTVPGVITSEWSAVVLRSHLSFGIQIKRLLKLEVIQPRPQKYRILRDTNVKIKSENLYKTDVILGTKVKKSTFFICIPVRIGEADPDGTDTKRCAKAAERR